MIKKALVPALAVAVASVAVPAAAQSYGPPRHAPAWGYHHGGWQAISHRKYNLDRRIDNGVRSRQLSLREARRLKSELNQLVRLEARYARGGLTRWEQMDLDRRYDRLSMQVRVDRRDRDRRPW